MLCSPSWRTCDLEIILTSSASPIRSKFGSRTVWCRWRHSTSETPRSSSSCWCPPEVRDVYALSSGIWLKLSKSCWSYRFLCHCFLFFVSVGTNIDGAIQTSSSVLRDYLSGSDSGPNSVSLIIFLTDGRPTTGEVQSATILGNTRSAVQEKFCIFTIGIGNDVDYRLLERMALDNCGMMRRIPEEADASAMLKGYGWVSF